MTPRVLAAVGLEPVDAELVEQVAPFCGPPRAGLSRGEVREQRAREPPAAVCVRAPVGFPDGKALLDERAPVVLELAARRRRGLQ